MPGPGSYDANLYSVYANKRDSGAHMRSKQTGRFAREVETTPRHLGPGAYGQHHQTLRVNAELLSARGSKRKPGFGSRRSKSSNARTS